MALTAQDADSVRAKSKDVVQWEDNSKLPRTLLEGTKGMREAGKDYLPQHNLEGDIAYADRLAASTLLNAYAKTTSFLAGQVFQVDVIFEDGIDSTFEEWAKEIDSTGNTLDVFAKRNFFNGCGKGVSHIFIDMAKADESVQTVKDEKEAGLRPYFREVDPKDVLGGIVDEEGFPIQVRLAETVVKQVGRFGTKTVNRIRVIEVGFWELYEEGEGKSMDLIDTGTFSADVLPFVSFIPGKETSFITGETPLMDLAELNGKHWRSSSNQDNYLAQCRFPLYFGKKMGDLSVLPTGRALINSDEDNADLKTVEMTGASIEAGRMDLKETEAQMALYGLRQLVPSQVAVTATQNILTASESNSSLGTWANEYEAMLIAAFKIAASFMDKEFPDEGLAVNKEFSLGIADPQELAQVLKSQEQGIISAQACFTEFRRRGVYEEHLSWEDMEADLEQEKRDNIDMARMAGAAFGDAPGDDTPEGKDEEDV